MKKNKRTLSLLVGLLSVFGLSGCSDVTQNDNNIITFKNSNGETITIKADDIYHGELKDSESIKEFYDALFEVALRNKMSGPEYKAKMESINDSAKSLVEGAKETAKANRETNGTSYDEEWEKILDSNGAEDEEELFNINVFKLMNTEYQKEFYSTEKLASLLSEEDDGYLDKMVPYHVRHILVKTNGSNREFTNDTIGKDEALKLRSVIQILVDGRYSFGQVAKEYSDDSGEGSSASKYGDLGIMSKSTGFVNEFKLGVYAYDMLYDLNRNTVAEGEKKPSEVLGVSQDIIDEMKEVDSLKNIGQIPYSAVEQLYEYHDVTKNNQGGSVNEGESKYYPRNVIFNKYFNKHNISLITPNATDAPVVDPVTGEVTSEDFIGNQKDVYANKGPNWMKINIINEAGATEEITCLSDGRGNPILVTRAGTDSYQGIHFIVIERNPMDKKAVEGDTLSSSIEDYYTTLIPGDPDYPVNGDGEAKKTFVTALNLDRSEQLTRAEEVKTAIKSYDDHINYRMYEELFAEQSLTIKNTDISEKVEKYIASVREESAYSALEAFEDAWQDYILMLEQQDIERANTQRLLSETCALGFRENSSSKAYTETTGACYYVKK